MTKSTSCTTSDCCSSKSCSSSCSSKGDCKPIKKLIVRRINANKINCKNLSVHNNAFIKNDLVVSGNTDLHHNLVVHRDTRIKKKLTIGDAIVNLDDNVGLVVEKRAIFNDQVRVNGQLTTQGLEVRGLNNTATQLTVNENGVFLANVRDCDNINTVRQGYLCADFYGYLRLVQ